MNTENYKVMGEAMNSRKLYQTLNYISTFFLLNLCFVFSNILFFTALLLFPFSLENIMLFYISLLPMGASLTALFSTNGRLLREGSITPVKDFFMDYKTNFKLSFIYWFIQLTILLILFVDFFYMLQKNNLILACVVAIILAIVFITTSIGLSVLSRFESNMKTLLKAGPFILLRFPGKAFLHLSTSVILVVFFYYVPAVSFLFAFSLFGFILMYYTNPVLYRLEKELKNENQSKKLSIYFYPSSNVSDGKLQSRKRTCFAYKKQHKLKNIEQASELRIKQQDSSIKLSKEGSYWTVKEQTFQDDMANQFVLALSSMRGDKVKEQKEMDLLIEVAADQSQMKLYKKKNQYYLVRQNQTYQLSYVPNLVKFYSPIIFSERKAFPLEADQIKRLNFEESKLTIP
ncbi:DUF624 domain-containing protein [Niallia circulans]